MVPSVRPAQLLRRLVLASFTADVVYTIGYFLLPQPFLGLHQGMITVILALLLGVMVLLWLAVLLTGLVIAWQRHEAGWLAAFVVLAVVGVVLAAIAYFEGDVLMFLATTLNILALGNGYLALTLVVFVVFVVCPLPVPLTALRYADAMTTEAI